MNARAESRRGAVSEPRRLLELTVTLAVTDFKLRYYGNALGYFWTLAKPLMVFGVIYVAFTEILKIGDTVPDYPAVLISGLVLYNFFGEATSTSTASLVASGALIRKIPVPALAVPLSMVLRSMFTLGLNLIAVLVFFAISGVPVTASWLEFPLILGALLLFTTGVSALLANLYVPFRDTAQIWEVLLQLLFWGSVIIYPVESIPESLREIVMFNPLAVIMVQNRHAMVDPSAPSAADVASDGQLIVVGLIVLGTLAAGALLYRRVRPRLAEQV